MLLCILTVLYLANAAAGHLWTKHQDLYCDSYEYLDGNVGWPAASVEAALEACADDPGCAGIGEWNCGDGEYRACGAEGYGLSNYGAGRCTWVKPSFEVAPSPPPPSTSPPSPPTDSKDGQTDTISIKEVEADSGSLPKGKATVRDPLAEDVECMHEHLVEDYTEDPNDTYDREHGACTTVAGSGQTKTFYFTDPGMPHRDQTPD